MDQAQLEMQLKVWRELAISKQVLMRTAAEALKLDPDCSQEDLKKALDAAMKKNLDTEANLNKAREQHRVAIAVAERKLAAMLQAQTAAEATVAELLAKQENAARSMAVERASAVKELQQVKDRLAEKDKALKAINTALADTPENVIKKMNVLKKQKQDEADARRQVETAFGTLRKEKQQQDQQLTTVTANTTKLVAQYRDLHAVCVQQNDQLKTLGEDAKSLPAVPDLDTKLLEEIEQPKSKATGKGDKVAGVAAGPVQARP